MSQAQAIFNGLRDGAPTYLVTVDGTPYRIGTTGRPGSPRSTLSADGRWLARGRPDGWVIRDLESTREHRAPADLQPVAWSGRSLYWSARYDAYRVMDLASGRLDPAPFTVSATASSLQVISEQEAAVTDAIETMRDDRHPRMRVFDVRTGSDVRTVTLDLTAHLRPGEHSVIYLIPLMHTGGTPRRLWIPVGAEPATPGPEAQPNLEVAALEVDLADGRVVSRVDWSPPRRGDATSLSGAVPDGAVLTHSTSDSTEVIVVPAGGTRRTVTRIAGLVAVYPAGRPF